MLPEYHSDSWQLLAKKQLAYRIFNEAIRTGELVRPNRCSNHNCQATTNIHGHHEDYDKPLEVEWLCGKCHKARHREVNNNKEWDEKANEEALRVYREKW